eukprot:214851_1
MKQLQKALPSLNQSLVECIFKDIKQFDNINNNNNNNALKLTSILRWINEKKRQKDIIIVKDEEWLFHKLKKTQFTELDNDENFEVEYDEFQTYFDKQGVDTKISSVIFNNIDKNGDGSVSIKEWFQWQQKFKKSHLKKLFPKN